MTNAKKTKIIYPDFSERNFLESYDQGFLGGSTAQLVDGKKYSIYFYSAASLKSEMDQKVSIKVYLDKFIAEPGLIVIPEITKEYMENAVEKLYEQGYFEHLKPLE